MKHQTIANRYVKALSNSVPDIERTEFLTECHGRLVSLTKTPEFNSVVLNPLLDKECKKKIFAELFKGVSHSDVVLRLFDLLTDRGRLNIIEDIIDSIYTQLLQLTNKADITVYTKDSLSSKHLKEFSTFFSKKLNKEISLISKQDNTIIGGFIASDGTTVYDATINNQLSKVRELF